VHLPFWLTTALLAPIVVYQGKRTRQRTPRLPEASGPASGQYGKGQADLRLLVIGESTAAGVGVDRHEQGLASQLTRQLHQHTGRTLAWHTLGINGATLAQLTDFLARADLPDADVVLLSMGVNDTTRLTPRHRFREQLLELRQLLLTRRPELARTPLQLLKVPPVHRFTALPAPLRHLLGWRARQLDAVYRRLARQQPADFAYVAYPPMNDPQLLARDGYHPSAAGYRTIARVLVEQGWGLPMPGDALSADAAE
jgi:lysophospholipase L1-like esterase